MNDDDRLIRCFASVFPSATSDEIRTAKLDTISGWDSLRGVTLLSVIDDEFSVQMDLQKLLDLGTFDGVKQYLLEKEKKS